MLQLKRDGDGVAGGGASPTLDLPTTPRLHRVDWLPARAKGIHLAERLLLIALVCDSVVIGGGLLLAFWLRFYTPIHSIGVPATVSLWDYEGYIVYGGCSLLGAMSYFKVYDRRCLLRFRRTGERMMKACAVWFVAFQAFLVMFRFPPAISRIYVAISAVVVTAGILGWRFGFHRFLQKSKAAENLRQRVLFVGWNEETQKMSDSFEADAVHPYQVAGCVPSPGSQFRLKPRVPVLGDYSDLPLIFRAQLIDMVLMSDVDCARGEVMGLAHVCEKAMVQFKIIPSYFQILSSGLQIESVSGVPVLGVSQLPLDVPANFLLKRVVDIIGAIVGLIISIPLVAIFGLLVYVESPGPILYRQRRMGLGGQTFDIIKIRSMRPDAESGTGARWAVKDDPRRLRVGAFMRAWNIDEVPQFWNVLMGEMSLVGPRPERPELIERFKEQIAHYNARHFAKPGITGWAQVKGLRGDTNLPERIRADLYYLENWNIFFDFQVMIMTFLNNRNAY